MIALATLSLGSLALAAVPASAAAPSDITRQQVLAAASAVRAEPSPSALLISSTTSRALRVLTNRACSIDPDGEEFAVLSLSEATAPGQSADGVVVTALVVKADVANLITSFTAIEEPPAGVEIGDFLRLCSFGVLAPTAGSSTLTGTATIGGEAPAPFTLAGEVFVTPPTNTTDFSFITDLISSTDEESAEAALEVAAAIIAPTFTATGNAVRTFDVPATSMVSTPKTAAQQKAAKATYDKKLKSAKAAYAKAAKKAGSSKAKRKAAKKAHAAKRAAAKAAYQQAVAASSQLVASTTKSSESSPFSVTTQVDLSTILDFLEVPPVE